ncbi:hypothetical protein [Pontibacter burrus]|uniref:Uncharacterized protein n=1 Tax=Pontibacter burrus TaxID=2704466 RepID=A0A6B3LPC6_9BACT|nr:hypothetical protein [Pontibacter burrus]NEM98669.1 hypothetical protein [Pontibacter burrus]
MKFKKILTYSLPFLLSLQLFACNGPNTTHNMTTELIEFSEWVNKNAAQSETISEENWNTLNAEFERRAATLESSIDEWDETDRQLWLDLESTWAVAKQNVSQRYGQESTIDQELSLDTVSVQ